MGIAGPISIPTQLDVLIADDRASPIKAPTVCAGKSVLPKSKRCGLIQIRVQ
jgi:hypothetical protein